MTKAVEKETPKNVRRRLSRRLQVRSADIAIEALEEVCANKKAPAPARATAGTSLLRAAGYFDSRERQLEEKQPHEMSPEELQEAIARLQENAEGAADAEENVFE